MADLDKESSEIAKEKRKQRAKERLNSLNSGDITRGLNSGIKERGLVSDTYSTQQAKAKLNAKAKAKTKNIENVASDVKKSATSKENASKKTKATAVNPEVFEDDILLEENSKKKKSKKQIGNIVVDETALENISTATTDRRSRRNKVIISILIVAILLIWGAVLIMLLVKPKKEEHNCFMYLSGNASSNCELLMNNQKVTSWKIPDGVTQGSTYTFDVDLKIKQEGVYTVKFRVEVKNNDTIIESVIEVVPGTKEVVDGNGVEWYIYENVVGNSTLELINKITFIVDWSNQPLSTLDNSNIELNIYVDVFSN